MRILTVLTYYRPHTSGLTIYAERLAKALVKAGHEVTVLTMQYEKHLPLNELIDGVKVVRVPVAMRISKGCIAPKLGWIATKLALSHDVFHLHLPQFDAAGVSFRGFLFRKPTILTYHCDLKLPPGLFNAFVNQVVHLMDGTAAALANRIVTYTEDYAKSSPFLSKYPKKLRVIPPPVELPHIPEGAAAEFGKKINPNNQRPVIAMAARLAAEKGIEVLLGAMPKILEKFPNALVAFAGQYKDVLGEKEYFDKVMPTISKYESEGHWKFLGVLSPQEMAAFYPNLDLLVVPSLNSTESFGLVQIEAMMNGVPVVASNLPGVRQPVLTTGMGKIAPIGESAGLADAIIGVLSDKQSFIKDSAEIAARFSPAETARTYSALYEEMLAEFGKRPK